MRIALTCFLVLACAVFAAPAAGQDAPAPAPAEDAYTARSADVARASAAKLWTAVADARRNALWEFAVREARRVVELDPDHRDARALLGFVRRDAAWVEDPALAAKSPRTNFPEKAPPLEQAAAAERRWLRDVVAPARASAAAAWTSFGEDLAKKGDAAGAGKAHRRALELDADQARSRAALGWFRWKGVWLTERQVRAVESACRGEVVDAESPADRAFGTKLLKVRTPHFQVESRIAAERLLEIARWLETAYAVHLADLGRDPSENAFPSLVRMVVCDSDAEWNTFVNTFVTRNRDFYRTLEGCWADGWVYGMRPPPDGSDETRRDHLVHRAVHAVDQFALGIFWPHWADEGLAHLTTIRVQGMTRTWCMAPSRSEYAKLDQPGGKSGWVDEKEWRSIVRASAVAHDDLPLRTLVSQPFPELGFAGVMKAWSVLDWLRTDDPASFRALLPKFRTSKDGTAAIESHFGRGLEALDEEWRRYVVRSY
jgi:hypothetical protein